MVTTIFTSDTKPSRDEFYTNYPFFKYWNKQYNNPFLSPDQLNIYIHFPYCVQKCDYCFYKTDQYKSPSEIDKYVNALCSEIKLISNYFNLKKRPVDSIYMGGGTPSLLKEHQFNKISETLHKYHSIGDTEFTIEAEPGTFNRNKIKWYEKAGVNRISIGVQSFEDEIIRLSSRKHTAKQAIESINLLKEFENLTFNIDLLSGLAGESLATFQQSVDIALQKEVKMLTIYKMIAYANTSFFNKSVRKKEISLPSSAEEAEFYESVVTKILEAGYYMWSTFAFTKNIYLHRYIENTWRGKDCAAYGVSAFGKMGDFLYQNFNITEIYVENIFNDKIPVYRSYKLSVKDMIVKELLLCVARLNSYTKKEFIDKFGFDYYNLIPETINDLYKSGYIENNNSDLTLTKKGIVYGDYVGKILASAVKEKLGNDDIGFTY